MGRTRAQLSITYHEIARRLLLKQETSLIAQAMCIPEETIKTVMRRPSFTAYLSELETRLFQTTDQGIADKSRNLREELEAAAYKSFDKLKDLLEMASTESLQANIAQDLMDRAGYGRTQKVETEQVIHIDPITADVLLSSIRKEKEARATLGGKEPELVKSPAELDHPVTAQARLLAEQEKRESSSDPTK